MATSNLIEQHILFISNSNVIDDTSILANSLIQSLAANSAGNDIILSYQNFYHWNGTNFIENSFLEIRCYVSSAFQTTIQQNIPNLQANFPAFQIVTWGYAVTFGF